MQIRVSPGIVGPVLRGVVVVLISGPMKRSVGSMGLKSSVQSASESFVCHHGSFQSLWPEPQQYATSTAPLPARLLQDQQRVFPSFHPSGAIIGVSSFSAEKRTDINNPAHP